MGSLILDINMNCRYFNSLAPEHSQNKANDVHPPFQMELNHAVDQNLMIERKNVKSREIRDTFEVAEVVCLGERSLPLH